MIENLIKDSINNNLFKIISKCSDEIGLECYLIGGFVRDLFLGSRKSKDIDILEIQKTPTTIIFEKVKNLNTFSNTIGIRIPKDSFCSDLLKKFKKPIISTSVNISGKKFPNYFKDISESILNQVDFAVNLRHEEKLDTASKIIKIKNNKIIIIRS